MDADEIPPTEFVLTTLSSVFARLYGGSGSEDVLACASRLVDRLSPRHSQASGSASRLPLTFLAAVLVERRVAVERAE